MTWPKEYGGQEKQGVYEYILNEALSRRGAPQIGKGVGIIGKTLIRHGSEKLKREFLPQIIRGEIEFAVGYSEPQAGSDAANMQLKAEPRRRRLAAQRPEDLDDLGPLRRLVLGRRAHRSGQAEARRHHAVPDPDEPPGAHDPGTPTIGDERTNEVFFDDVFVPDDYLVGQRGSGFQYISEALDLERFTMFTFSPIEQRSRSWSSTCAARSATASRCARPARAAAHRAARHAVRGRARALAALRRGHDDGKGKPPTVEASQYKLFITELSQRVANAALDMVGAGAQLRVHRPDAPLRGRPEMTYRYSVIDTIGGGASEIQKNIIARRKLGLPKNF